MKVSVAWIAVGIIIGIILFFTVQGFSIYEQFTNPVEGFTDADEQDLDIKITTCPADTSSYVDGGGRTVCCDGTVANGKCSGKNVCSLSEPIAGLPTCSAWLDAYLENKGSKRCPQSMPNYYENKNAMQSGCTAGHRNAQGTGPAATTNKFCTLYHSEKDETLKLDSCTNQKMLEEAKCLSKPTSRSLSEWGGVPPAVNCSGIDTGSLTPLTCLDDYAFARIIDYWAGNYAPQYKNWKEQSVAWGANWKMNFCSVVQKVTVDKSMNMRELEGYKVFN